MGPFERKSDKQRQTLKKIAEIKVCQKSLSFNER